MTRVERNRNIMAKAADAGVTLAAMVRNEVITKAFSGHAAGGAVIGAKVFVPDPVKAVVTTILYLAYDEETTEWTGTPDIEKAYRWSDYPWTAEREQGARLGELLARSIRLNDKTRHFERVENSTTLERKYA